MEELVAELRGGQSAAARRPVLPPLSLYVHVPWCLRKCPYCDFNSHALADGARIPEERYVEALLADLRAALPGVQGRPLQSVFIGGGTPSLLSAAAVGRLLQGIGACAPLADDCEITLEANPGTLEAGRFAQFRRAGINRLSVGAQSFDDAMLRALGRVHDGGQALRAAREAQAHFDNFNVDLMIGLPGQQLESARRDLLQALELAPPHLSVYQLTLEPNTVFHKYPPTLPDDDTLEAIQEMVDGLLEEHGYEHYEVSAYARAGRRSRHNLNYWTFGDYLGIGAGAHAKISLPASVERSQRWSAPQVYLEQAARGRFVSERRELAEEDLVFEFMLNALRLRAGFAPELFGERTGLPFAALGAGLAAARARGLIEQGPDSLRPTALGLRFLNDLHALFLPPSLPGQRRR
jgi:oxygen-independent coproporphyrinogen-3 oxidase